MNNYNKYIGKIIKYWFNNNYRKINYDKWFKNGQLYDSEIKKKFKYILEIAEKGLLESWNDTKDGFLALIILLDQFSRHIYRNTSKAYQNDSLTIIYLDRYIYKYINKLKPIESLFALMPYQHSESICKQSIGIILIKYLLYREKTIYGINILNDALYHQQAHYDVIKQFGRFPKRNKFLNRISTNKEIEYIKSSNQNLPY